MSDPDRGAYTPQTDAPLSFDARQPRGGRKAFPTTLVVSLVILVGLGVAIFMFYRQGVRGADDAPQPVGAPVGEIKAAPGPQTQAPADPAAGLQIYKAEGNAETAAASSTAQFAPPPEQPKPRPVTPVAAAPLAAPAAPPPPAKPVVAAPVAAVPVAAAKPAPVAAAPVAPVKPKDDVVALLDSKSAPAKKAEAPAKTEAAKPKAEAAPAPANVAHGAAVVQFGAFSSSALAASEWAKLAKAYPDLMSGKGKLVESVEVNGKTLFRGAVSGFGSRPDAAAFCAKLKADGKACIVK